MKKIVLILLIVIGATSCAHKKKPLVITVDFKDLEMVLPYGDSVFTCDSRSVMDDLQDSSDIRFMHSVPRDTIIRFVHLKPFVVIAGTDTTRSYFRGDTIMFSTCDRKPDTVIKVIYKNIKNAENVYIGSHP